MGNAKDTSLSKMQLLEEIEQLRVRLDESEQTLKAIRSGEVDAIVVNGPKGDQIFSLTGAESSYRTLVETMNEAALTLSSDGTILFCNSQFCEIVKEIMPKILGRKIFDFVDRPQKDPLARFLEEAQHGPVQRHIILLASDSTSFPVQLSASPMDTISGKSICLVATDLTELENSITTIHTLIGQQKQLEEKEVELVDSRQAALNLMEDAIQAREREADLNAMLHSEIEERQKTEIFLRKSREEYRHLVEGSNSIILRSDRDMNISFMNEYGMKYFGYQPEDIIGKCALGTIIPHKDSEGRDIASMMEDLMKNPDAYPTNVHENMCKDGSLVWVSWSNKPIYDDQGNLVELLAIGNDLTQLKKAEDAVARERSNLQTMFDVVNFGMLLVDADGFIKRVNNTISRWVGKDLSECPDCQPGDFLGCIHAVEHDVGCGHTPHCTSCPVRATFESVFRSGASLHHLEMKSHFALNGKYDSIWIELSADPLVLNGQQHVILAINNITARKQAELALEASRREIMNEKNRLEVVMETLPVGMVIVDENGGTVRSNSMFEKIWGSSHTEIKGVSDYENSKAWWIDTGEPVKPEEWASARAVQRGETVMGQEIQIERNDGTYAFILNGAAPISDADGRITGSVVAILDITKLKQAEEKLMETRDYLDKLLNYANAPVVVWDPDMKITLFNRAFEKLTGYSAREVIGQELEMLFPPEDKKAILESIAHVSGGLRLDAREIPILRKDGDIRIALWNSAEVISSDGKNLVATVAQGQDITERLKMEEALKERERDYRSLAENTPDLIKRFDRNMRFIYANPPVSGLFGLPVKDIIGKTLTELGAEPDKVQFLESHFNKVFATGVPEVVDFRIKSPQGKQFYYDTRIMPEFSGKEITSVLAISRDISDIKYIQERLEEKNKELEQFAYVASHDLQEPLRMVNSFTELLERRYKEQFDEKALGYMKFIVDGATRMQQLIEDLLQFSKVGRTDTEGSLVDCNGIIDKVILNLTDSINKTGAEVTHDFLPVLFANETRLIQLFQNLIGNGIKFRKKESTPHVHISAEQRGDEWLFSVKDNGMGINPKYFGKLFVIFQRLHGRDEYPGTGIGLAISKKIVEKYGGKIWVESAEGEGTTFYFTFPS
jgi:PAS domain S-box-containing protein